MTSMHIKTPNDITAKMKNPIINPTIEGFSIDESRDLSKNTFDN